MKNVHLIATDKPSKLYVDSQNNICTADVEMKCGNKRNIYITNSEEIKEGDWFYLDDAEIVTKYISVKPTKEAMKIILTTDAELIADGVQPIDDEFLQWFVKNSSCEYVDVELHQESLGEVSNGKNTNTMWTDPKYKIIIPKEEPKQETHICKHCGVETIQSDDECYAKPETLEEVAIRMFNDFRKINQIVPKNNIGPYKLGFMKGAKWQHQQYVDFSNSNADKITTASTNSAKIQTERSYSEEEVLNIVKKLMHDVHSGDLCYGDKIIDFKISPKKWFNQFKKK
jgi:hypothetical protein